MYLAIKKSASVLLDLLVYTQVVLTSTSIGRSLAAHIASGQRHATTYADTNRTMVKRPITCTGGVVTAIAVQHVACVSTRRRAR